LKEIPIRGNIKIKDILDITSLIESAAECFKKKRDLVSQKNLPGYYNVQFLRQDKSSQQFLQAKSIHFSRQAKNIYIPQQTRSCYFLQVKNLDVLR
jgi:hypothetical protein